MFALFDEDYIRRSNEHEKMEKVRIESELRGELRGARKNQIKNILSLRSIGIRDEDIARAFGMTVAEVQATKA